MYKKSFVLIVLCVISQSAFAMSAFRNNNEHYMQAAKRNSFSRPSNRKIKKSAFDVAVTFEELNFSKVPTIKNIKDLTKSFEYLRNIRFMKNLWEDDLRRLSWFYPDDGCWLRAELMKENLRKYNKVKVSKIFVFGNLEMQSHYSPEGKVEWWYHVAPIVRLGDEFYVIDPVANQLTPMKLKDWISAFVKDTSDTLFSICHPNTFSAGSRCSFQVKTVPLLVRSTQKDYLTKEKNRLIELGLETELFLGDSPPWGLE